MAIQVTRFPGCCAATIVHELGTVHQRETAKSYEDFVLWFASKPINIINLAITNYRQTKEREYLERMGFEVISKRENTSGRLWIHLGTLDTIRSEVRRVQSEKLRKEQREAAEKLILAKAAGQGGKITRDLMLKLLGVRHVYMLVRIENISLCEKAFGISLSRIEPGRHTIESLRRSIISTLAAKEKKNAASGARSST